MSYSNHILLSQFSNVLHPIVSFSHLIERGESELGCLALFSIDVDGDQILTKGTAAGNMDYIHRVLWGEERERGGERKEERELGGELK